MKVLYIKTGSSKSLELKRMMTDQMWREVVVKYSNEDTCLLLEDKTIIKEISNIIKIIDPKYKTLTKKISRFMRAMISAGKELIRGKGIFINSEVKEQRKKLCKQCKFKHGRIIKTCNLCGCYLRLKIKMSTESCPLDKW